MTLKRCAQCKEEKTIDQFYRSRQGVNGPIYRTICKVCSSAGMRNWAKSNAERHALTRFRHNLMARYGMTWGQYEEMLASQDGKCAICRTAEETKLGPNGTTVRMSVDHCHELGHVRGLLCNRCNRALGLLGDSVDLLRKAIDYLERK